MEIYGKTPPGKPSDGDFFTEETKFDTSPLPRNMAAARSQNTENLERALSDAISAVRVSTPDRDSCQNARFRYERNYERLRQAARQVVLATGAGVSVPSYLPPPTKTEQFKTLTAADFPESTSYQERGARGKSTGVQPDFANPESDQSQAWLTAQGVPPVDTSGMSPADAGKARRARAGVKS